MTPDVFTTIRETVYARDAAKFYGMTLNGRGWALCPFHPDKHPSMSFKEGRFRCWSCGASGDAVDLVKSLLNCDTWTAVKQIDRDFALHLPLGDKQPTPQQLEEARQRQRTRELYKKFEAWRKETIDQLTNCIRLANTADWRKITAREAAAIRLQAQLEDIADRLMHGTPEQQVELFGQRKEVLALISSISLTYQIG